MYKIDGFLLENPPHTANIRYHSLTPSPGHTIPPSPSYVIAQSPGHTIPPSPVTISIPEDHEFTEAELNMIESEPQNRINILSQEIIVPPNNPKNIIKTAFLNAKNNNAMQ
ncbi:hypothetical protein EVAR_96346_1 [Eumeta japonica]|uniref:Uncharacterized protein n=1 Tax=Eumeta variegata TaxID=151549 RepID=A0A4C1VYS1_EUMVA|nr:hypothetical protein EVAR_96346_1 [Eumeta japonica]